MFKLYLQYWEESESGWGIRPDGLSLHPNVEKLNEYVEQYWSSMSKDVPHEYSRPCGKPTVVDVTEELYEQVQKSKCGLRFWQHENPVGIKI